MNCAVCGVSLAEEEQQKPCYSCGACPECDGKKSVVVGTWPEHCEQRAFVEGAKWWEFHQTKGTMWPSDRKLAEDEAVRRFGEPHAPA